MKKLLVTHVWNDELYIRGWLRHHKALFTHGVIIYYESSDNTLAIIKEEVPHWDIVKPTIAKLTTGELERQIHGIEALYPGWWKLCLTVTEYLIATDLDAELERWSGTTGFYLNGYGLVESLFESKVPYDKDVPVIHQRSFGFDMTEVYVDGRNDGRRYFHQNTNGNYSLGRHWTMNDHVLDHPIKDLFLVRAFYSPFNQEAIDRKLNMGKNISAKDIAEGRCWQHFYSLEDIQYDHKVLLRQSQSLAGRW
jgi:hypothetical protein